MELFFGILIIDLPILGVIIFPLPGNWIAIRSHNLTIRVNA